MNADLNIQIPIPEGVTISLENGIVKMQGKKGTVEKKIVYPKVKVSLENNEIILSCDKASKREKTMIGTFKAHINNMAKGVTEGHVYKLKICCSHFPMTVKIANGEMTIKNFLGEAYPRTVKIKDGVTVNVDGTDIVVESPDVELAGQMAANIEQSTRITNRDRRIFQDGIYIVDKRGKEM
jgi:large subunit ribosomal protein L6